MENAKSRRTRTVSKESICKSTCEEVCSQEKAKGALGSHSKHVWASRSAGWESPRQEPARAWSSSVHALSFKVYFCRDMKAWEIWRISAVPAGCCSLSVVSLTIRGRRDLKRARWEVTKKAVTKIVAHEGTASATVNIRTDTRAVTKNGANICRADRRCLDETPSNKVCGSL